MDDFENIDENHRIGAEYDDNPENPRESWDGHVIAFIECDDLYREYFGNGSRVVAPAALHDDPTGNLRDAFTRLYGLARNPRVSHYVSATATIERWARIFHGIVVEWDDEAQGFWAFSPAAARACGVAEDKITDLAHQAEAIESERFTYSQWAKGEVLYVFAQTRAVTHTIKKDAGNGTVLADNLTEEWVTTDSISSIFPDKGQDYGTGLRTLLRQTANDYFDEEYHSILIDQ